MNNKEEFYKKLIKHFSAEQQQTVAIEELSELIKELCKHQRGTGNVHHIAEEIADVTIMLEQLIIMFGCSTEVELLKEQKLQRTKESICKMNKKIIINKTQNVGMSEFELPLHIICKTDRKNLLLTCLKFINHLRENNLLDDIEIGNSSCRNCLDKISLFYELYQKYFGNDFDISNEIEKIEKPKQDLKFSKRELEFARLLCLPDSEIAKRLIVAPSTAKTHIHNIRIKMCTKTKASTIIELIRAGIIDINEVETE